MNFEQLEKDRSYLELSNSHPLAESEIATIFSVAPEDMDLSSYKRSLHRISIDVFDAFQNKYRFYDGLWSSTYYSLEDAIAGIKEIFGIGACFSIRVIGATDSSKIYW